MWTRQVSSKPFLHAIIMEEMKTEGNATQRFRTKLLETYQALSLMQDAWQIEEPQFDIAVWYLVPRVIVTLKRAFYQIFLCLVI